MTQVKIKKRIKETVWNYTKVCFTLEWMLTYILSCCPLLTSLTLSSTCLWAEILNLFLNIQIFHSFPLSNGIKRKESRTPKYSHRLLAQSTYRRLLLNLESSTETVTLLEFQDVAMEAVYDTLLWKLSHGWLTTSKKISSVSYPTIWYDLLASTICDVIRE